MAPDANMPEDVTDRAVAQWRSQRPDLDFSAMGPLARLARLAIFGGRLVDRVFEEEGLDRVDFNVLAGNFGQSGRVWHQGDFNYDGSVNLTDFNLLAGNFGLSASANGATAADWALLAATVPEPGATLLLGVVLAAACTRHRKRPTR